jgi:hypothetical protein
MVRREIVRFFRRHRLAGFCGAVILTLGFGTSTLALTFLLTFRSLSWPGIRAAGNATVAEEITGGGSTPISFERFERLRRSSAHVARLAAYSRLLPTNPGGPLIVAVSSGFFSVFTGPLAAGRDFSPIEAEGQSENRAAIVSYRVAERRFGSPANALGQNMLLKGQPFEIVGVASRDFDGMFGETVDVWAPSSAVIPLALDAPSGPSWKFLNVFYAVITADGRTTAQLTKDLDASLPPTVGTEHRLNVSPGLTEDPVRDQRVRARLRLGLALSVVFTLVSGLNLAWLLLAQTPRRAAETHLKKALGAGNLRLISEETMGPAAMIALGIVGAGILLFAGMVGIGRMTGIEGQAARGAWRTALLAWGVELPFAAALTCLVVVLPLIAVLRESGNRRAYHNRSSWPVGTLTYAPVILQVSLTAATCILAGMVASALVTEMNEFLGYDPSQLTVVSIGPASGELEMSWSALEVSPAMRALWRLVIRARSIPGVRAAAYGSIPDREDGDLYNLESDSGHSTVLTAQYTVVSPGYFHALGGILVGGRDFGPSDTPDNEIILNRAAARALWPNQRPVNRTVRIIAPATSGLPSHGYLATVIGVVADMRPPGYGRHAAPAIYTSMFTKGINDFAPSLILNGAVSWSAVDAALGKEVRAQLPGMKILSVYRVRDSIGTMFAHDATATYLAIGASLVMALVSSIGLYAALTWFVTSRLRELAIRVCLGASSSSIRRIIYGRAVFGAALGVLLSAPLWPVLARLSSVEYLGPVSWSTGRAVVISAVCVALSIMIARLAAREATLLSPAQVLREE